MTGANGDAQLVQRSVAGDAVALKLLLTLSHPALVARIGRRLPAELRAVVDPDDVAQEVYIEVFRRIRGLELRTPEAFERWLSAVALTRLRNAIRQQRALRRGGGWRRVRSAKPPHDTTTTLLGLLVGSGETPSGAVATTEAVAALHAALAELPTRQQRAIQLVYLEGRSVSETAGALACSERAIHGLCRRGLALLRARLCELNGPRAG